MVLNGTSHDELPKGHATIQEGYLNHWKIGRVLGTKGTVLDQLQKETRTHIIVYPRKNTYSETRKFCVTGTVSELHAALRGRNIEGNMCALQFVLICKHCHFILFDLSFIIRIQVSTS